jgi:hypothetical protein
LNDEHVAALARGFENRFFVQWLDEPQAHNFYRLTTTMLRHLIDSVFSQRCRAPSSDDR